MPWTFWATAIGLASMAGVPPLLGFVSKESVFGAFLDLEGGLSWVAFAIAVFGAVLTFAYCGKILTGAFLDVRDAARARGLERHWVARLSPVVVRAVGFAQATGEALAARGLGEGTPGRGPDPRMAP